MIESGRARVLPPRPSLPHVAAAALGAFCATAVIALAAGALEIPLVLGSFGATCVLVFGFPEAPFSQPRNVIAGHVLASLIGLAFLRAFGATWWSMAMAVAAAVAVMLLTRTVHPPAGSNPLIVMLSQPTWTFLLTPTLGGATLIVVVALIVNNLGAKRRYPAYWIGRSPPRDVAAKPGAGPIRGRLHEPEQGPTQ